METNKIIRIIKKTTDHLLAFINTVNIDSLYTFLCFLIIESVFNFVLHSKKILLRDILTLEC